MRTALFLAALLSCAPSVLAQQVILDFEKGYPEDQFYFLNYNAESAVELRGQTGGYLGPSVRKSTRATWRVEAGEGGLGYTGFGYLHTAAHLFNPSAPLFPDISTFTHLSLWYNNTTVAADAARVAFRFELHERDTETDPNGRRSSQVWIYQSPSVLTTPTGWTQLRIPLEAVQRLGDEGFAIPPGGFQGNGRLDLDRIKHWAIILVAEGEPLGTVIQGVTLFDYLTAEGSRPVAAEPGIGDPSGPLADALLPGYPNPFQSSATIAYTLGREAEVSLRVYDALGREVAVLVEPRRMAAGRYEASLDGQGLAAGTYVCVLDVEGTRFTRRVTRLR